MISRRFAARQRFNARDLAQGRATARKAIVMGVLERRGKVRTQVIENARRSSAMPMIREHVEPGSELFTDELKSYQGAHLSFERQVINRAVCYAKGKVHTNGLENFWSLLKRGIQGTYVSVEPFHLFRYLDEQAFRFNSRQEKDGTRFEKAVESIQGKRLSYGSLIGESAAS